MEKKHNLAVFASGSGSNLQSLIEACRSEYIKNAQIRVVFSNKKDAYALKRGELAGIETFFLNRKDFTSDEDYDLNIVKKLKELEIDAILLAGYLMILSEPLLSAYEGRILNIHPSLLPEFGGKGMYGIKVHREVIKAGKLKSGCSVHLVDEEIDGGAVLAQREVDVLPEDTAETLFAKVLAEEHKLYPAAVRIFLESLY